MSSLFSPPSSTLSFFNPSKPPTKPPRFTVRAVGRRIRYKGTAMREQKLSEMIQIKVAEAMAACDGEEDSNPSDGCKVAWDEVEELSQAKAHFTAKIASSISDPLESFCEGNPDSDECRIYDA